MFASATATNTAELEQWLDDRGVGTGPVQLEPIGDGHSNPTFRLSRGNDRWVLRRAPDGPLPPSTHDVLREAAWMQALGPTGFPVPTIVETCDDPGVVGSAFFVMELIEGFVPTESLPDDVDTPTGRRGVADAFVDVLADLHAIPTDLPALERFRRHGNYVDRQLKRFVALWETNQTRAIADMETVSAWLHEHRPDAGGEGVLHGDARPGNALFTAHGDAVSLVGLLDWELAAIGDPLADVGYLLATWAEPSDPDDPLLEVSRLTRAPGFPTRSELAERYVQRTGASMADLRYFEALALWKAVVIMEGNYRRFVEGRADNPFFATYADGLPRIAARALALTHT